MFDYVTNYYCVKCGSPFDTKLAQCDNCDNNLCIDCKCPCTSIKSFKNILLDKFVPSQRPILYQKLIWKNIDLVKIGQIWLDKDKRRFGRELLVKNIINGKAICKSNNKLSKIRLDRFKTKYILKEQINV